LDFFEKLKNNHNINLNKQQEKAVSHVDGPALVLAGPGSGKTTVITARAAHLILKVGVKPQNILTLTFNKAAQLEMERRFQKLYGTEVESRVHFATLHSFCNNVVRNYENMKGQRLRRIEGNDEDINKKHLLKDIYFNINNSKVNDDELENLINEIGCAPLNP
jgi:DNA helicase-2/ATP-dependent DNA helicase PcrA